MRNWLTRWLVVLMLIPGIVHAQAAAVSNMQRSVAGLIEQNLARRGFAANDPRWVSTLQGSGSSIAGAALGAAAVTAAGVTAPAWATVAATVALGALFTAGINLAIDGIKWLINSDGSVTYTGQGGSSGGGSAGSNFYAFLPNGSHPGYVYGSVGSVAVALAINSVFGDASTGDSSFTLFSSSGCVIGSGSVCTADVLQTYTGGSVHRFVEVIPTTTSWSPPAGSTALPSAPTTVTKSPTDAANDLTPEQKAKPANPELIAKIADAAMQKAASAPDNAGFPYDASHPITTADAQAYQQANPQNWPTVGDAVAPQVAPAGQPASQPWSLPSSAATPVTPPSSNNPTPPVVSPTLDWAIPNYGDSIGKQAVSVSFVPTVFAAPTGCPAPVSFTMFGKQYLIAYAPFCDLMSMVAPIFLACGAAAAALIFAESLKS